MRNLVLPSPHSSPHSPTGTKEPLLRRDPQSSLHLKRGKWSLKTSDPPYEPISEWKVFDIKAIHVKPLCEHIIRETFILASSGN